MVTSLEVAEVKGLLDLASDEMIAALLYAENFTASDDRSKKMVRNFVRILSDVLTTYRRDVVLEALQQLNRDEKDKG